MKIISAVFAALLLAQSVFAAEPAPEDVKNRLAGFFGPNFPLSAVNTTDVPNVYEVEGGSQIIYVTMHENLILIGQLYDMVHRVSLGEQKREKRIRENVEAEIPNIPVEDMVVFKGKDSKRHITVFTDVECGFCRKLHQEVPKLNEAGVDVRYVWFPNLRETSRPKAISVHCAKNPTKAMTAAKAGKEIAKAECDNPVDEQFAIGRKIGVQGTPFIVVDDMNVIGGYVPADQLLARLGLK